MKSILLNSKIGMFGMLLLLSLFVSNAAFAEPVRERLKKNLPVSAETVEEGDAAQTAVPLPDGVKLYANNLYNSDVKQRFDVYVPSVTKNAPVIFMVHGGAWCLGDKTAKNLIENKLTRWARSGFIIVSVNYRLVPQVDPVQQADDVARALAIAQVKVQSLGGDPSKFILMGHSSGAHLVAMLASAPSKAYSVGVKPWLGTILLDSAALNVKTIMEKKHYKFYDAAFGADPKYWQSVSPIDMLTAPTAPILAVCSLRREDSAQEAKAFVSKAVSLGIKARVLEEDFSHKDINVELGKPGAYTSAVEEFMASLDPLVKDMLANSK